MELPNDDHRMMSTESGEFSETNLGLVHAGPQAASLILESPEQPARPARGRAVFRVRSLPA